MMPSQELAPFEFSPEEMIGIYTSCLFAHLKGLSRQLKSETSSLDSPAELQLIQYLGSAFIRAIQGLPTFQEVEGAEITDEVITLVATLRGFQRVEKEIGGIKLSADYLKECRRKYFANPLIHDAQFPFNAVYHSLFEFTPTRA
ncbi:MAG: hypothetical protein ABI758_00885 [Candidatus Woesebacteria bacterium]